MWRKFCRFLLTKVLGWTIDDGVVPVDKCIILGVPHTSVWDFLISYLYYEGVGGNARCMVKKEMFFPPLGWLLRALGAFPIDRSSSTKVVMSTIHEMERSRSFHLAIAPEGTRKPVRVWKTGFHLIARETGVPVYLGYFDWGTKHVGHGKEFPLTDDARADMKAIQAIYASMHLTGRHPGQYRTS